MQTYTEIETANLSSSLEQARRDGAGIDWHISTLEIVNWVREGRERQ